MSIFTGTFKRKAAPWALAVGLGLATAFNAAARDTVEDTAPSASPIYGGALDSIDSSSLLSNPAYYLTARSPHIAVQAIVKAMAQSPQAALKYADRYAPFVPKDRQNELANTLFTAMAQSPQAALEYADRYAPFVPKDRQNELVDILLATGVQDPLMALKFANSYAPFVPKNKQNELADTLFTAMAQRPWMTLVYADRYAPFVPENRQNELANILLTVGVQEPKTALEYADCYAPFVPKDRQNELANILLAAMAAQKPWMALEYVGRYAPFVPKDRQNELAKALLAASVQEPAMALEYADRYAPFVPKDRQNELANILLTASVQEPEIALKYADRYASFVPEGRFASALEQAALQLIATMRGMPLLSKQQRYLTPYLGAETIETLVQISHQRAESQNTGQRLNHLHDEPDSVRFSSVAESSAAKLFNLMIFGREELYTSSYLGVFDRFTDRLAREGHDDIYAAFDPRFKTAPRIFLDMAVEYGTIGRAVRLIPEERWNDVLSQYAAGMEAGEASSLIALAEIMHVMPDENVKRRMEVFLQQKYDTAPDARSRDIYGMAATYYNGIAVEEAVRIADPARYRAGTFDRLPKEGVFGTDGIHRQLFVFTGDKDGYASFAHFLSRYRDNEKYTLEEEGGYIKIISASGHPVEIYANRPDASPDIIIDLLAGHENASIKDVEIDAVIHRGHSYNLENTMPYFSHHNRFMFLGSCGGFSNIERLMKIAPGVQISSTKQKGTMFINDPLLFEMTEQIRENGFVNWNRQQAYLESLVNADKNHYILPHKNIALAINARLRELAEQREALQQTQRPQSTTPTPLRFPAAG